MKSDDSGELAPTAGRGGARLGRNPTRGRATVAWLCTAGILAVAAFAYSAYRSSVTKAYWRAVREADEARSPEDAVAALQGALDRDPDHSGAAYVRYRIGRLTAEMDRKALEDALAAAEGCAESDLERLRKIEEGLRAAMLKNAGSDRLMKAERAAEDVAARVDAAMAAVIIRWAEMLWEEGGADGILRGIGVLGAAMQQCPPMSDGAANRRLLAEVHGRAAAAIEEREAFQEAVAKARTSCRDRHAADLVRLRTFIVNYPYSVHRASAEEAMEKLRRRMDEGLRAMLNRARRITLATKERIRRDGKVGNEDLADLERAGSIIESAAKAYRGSSLAGEVKQAAADARMALAGVRRRLKEEAPKATRQARAPVSSAGQPRGDVKTAHKRAELAARQQARAAANARWAKELLTAYVRVADNWRICGQKQGDIEYILAEIRYLKSVPGRFQEEMNNAKLLQRRQGELAAAVSEGETLFARYLAIYARDRQAGSRILLDYINSNRCPPHVKRCFYENARRGAYP
jgi:hypothetical protein